MTTQELVRKVVEALEQLGVPYMVVGSFSSNAYGVARNTQDADFVVQLDRISISQIAAKLAPDFQFDPQMSFETITATTRYILEAPVENFEVELFLLSDDAHDRMRFERRRRVEMFGASAFLPTAEDVVITKLRWSRQKDLSDARDVIAISGSQLDWTYIERWCEAHGTLQLLQDLRRSIDNL
jgi:isopropylmalate/homocitrate/citramalate synthase